MKLFWKSLPAALALCCAAAAPLEAETYEEYVGVQRILGAALVDLQVMPDTEPQRALVVTAEVPSAGWHDGELDPVIYVTFPQDGIWDVYAVAQAPDGMSAQVISKLVLAMDVSGEPGELKGYRIHATGNCVVVLFDPKTELTSERCPVLGRE
ncbi:MAG TPA: hypothetical protein VJL84_11265 [Kiloniellales bacterium]|nr:hypothetical protein [Kiloniellales bacterium]